MTSRLLDEVGLSKGSKKNAHLKHKKHSHLLNYVKYYINIKCVNKISNDKGYKYWCKYKYRLMEVMMTAIVLSLQPKKYSSQKNSK